MMNIKEILAQNLKENRQRLGITQPELAERAGMSTQYLAMIEIARKFPTADILERLAAALDINPHELFSVAVSPERAMEQLQQMILDNMNRSMEQLQQMILDNMNRSTEQLQQMILGNINRTKGHAITPDTKI